MRNSTLIDWDGVLYECISVLLVDMALPNYSHSGVFWMHIGIVFVLNIALTTVRIVLHKSPVILNAVARNAIRALFAVVACIPF